jgi:ketosteroid isomerase-like protein
VGATENLDLVRRGYAAFGSGDMETLQGLFKPDIVHSVPGTSALAGDHKGPQEVLAMYGNLFALSDGTASVELEDVLSDGGNRVIAIHTATATRNGVTRTSRDALLFTIDNGKVASIQDFFGDIDEEDSFWS